VAAVADNLAEQPLSEQQAARLVAESVVCHPSARRNSHKTCSLLEP
jgi:hypothetical protein